MSFGQFRFKLNRPTRFRFSFGELLALQECHGKICVSFGISGFDPDCNPVVTGTGQIIIEASTAQTGVDQVVVTGAVRMQVGPGVSASGNDLTGTIYLFGN